ncbi:MAG TPA: hypothetical protein VMU48_12285 [Terracidiphilus sp.]|nr:hypothetical protein [Terracidiphilus sp.]
MNEQSEFLKRAERTVSRHVESHPGDVGALRLLAEIGEATQRNARQQEDAEHDRIKMEAELKFSQAGLPPRLAPYGAMSYTRGHTTSTFKVAGRSVSLDEFRSELSKRGIKAASFEKRLSAVPGAERFTTRSAVTVNESPSS